MGDSRAIYGAVYIGDSRAIRRAVYRAIIEPLVEQL